MEKDASLKRLGRGVYLETSVLVTTPEALQRRKRAEEMGISLPPLGEADASWRRGYYLLNGSPLVYVEESTSVFGGVEVSFARGETMVFNMSVDEFWALYTVGVGEGIGFLLDREEW